VGRRLVLAYGRRVLEVAQWQEALIEALQRRCR